MHMFSRVGKQTNNMYIAFNKGHSLYTPPEHEVNEFEEKPTIQQVTLWYKHYRYLTNCKRKRRRQTRRISRLYIEGF